MQNICKDILILESFLIGQQFVDGPKKEMMSSIFFPEKTFDGSDNLNAKLTCIN